MITDTYITTAMTRKALGDRLLRQYARRKAMVALGTTEIRHFAMLDRAMADTTWNLIHLGAGAELLRVLRGEK